MNPTTPQGGNAQNAQRYVTEPGIGGEWHVYLSGSKVFFPSVPAESSAAPAPVGGASSSPGQVPASGAAPAVLSAPSVVQPAAAAASVPSPAPPANPVAAGIMHTVAHGETLASIAQANNTSPANLTVMNPQIKNPERIFPGQRINIGGGVSLPAANPMVTGAVAAPAGVEFPKTSSYPSAQQLEATVKAELAGWAGGTGGVAADPAKGVIEAVSKPDTDPLKIKHDKPPSQ
ncbi:MAG TPA: LysM domain-containing protein [Candidatus Saccharimonadales bacterium]